MTEIILKQKARTCPVCNSDWDGGDIVETFIKQREEGITRWKGMSDQEIEDCVKGWSQEKINSFIESIEDPNIKQQAYDLKDRSDRWPLQRLLGKHFDVFICGTYSPPYRWGREIGIEVQGRYDGISYWQCPDCNSRFDRFKGKKVDYDS